MARTAMTRIKPLHPELKPPKGAVAAGHTPDGKQLYRLTRSMARSVPRKDENGQRMYRKNQITGEPVYPLNKPELFQHEELFTLVSEGNGNIVKEPYFFPSAAELAAAQLRQQIADTQEGFAKALVDSGLTVEEAIARLMGTKTAPEPAQVGGPPGPRPAPTPELLSFPQMRSPGRWTLSNGSKVQGNREDAEKAEEAITDDERAAVAETKAVAAMLPEE